jgi:hypothetical protein
MKYRVVHVPWAKPAMDRLMKMDWAATTVAVVIFSAREPIADDVLRHELVHVAQWYRYPWGVFPVVYAWAGIRAVMAGGNFYWDNSFELEAYRAQRRGSRAG